MKALTLRIATYNLQKCVGLDLRRRPDRSLAVLESTGADLVVLQEADKRMPPRPAALPDEMAEANGWQVADLGEPGGSLGWHGNAFLLRGKSRVLDTGHIELPGLEPRGAIRVDLDTPIGPLRVIGVHLGLLRRYRLLQVAAIRRAIDRLPVWPTVIAGDFNDWGDMQALQSHLGPYRIQPSRGSFPAPRPIAALDRFAIGPGLQPGEPTPHIAQPARIASDHLPVWIDIAATPAVAALAPARRRGHSAQAPDRDRLQ
ncbi:endonuclease/exonuclease/phosphatase family protein [Pseudooceanicola sp.]|uniref:endonuclease/exonuclease/phosphatase family protein n=1 Tax=Pseudooceanicola sp. TaxID=1914328 RepID=UPI002603B200|nr:endonuclease/exonuclease/phosphatase family protein [Pseudooceanicola sp.]MDF1854143.1 endonuclease/exonuclease/phosphatase family protein [Pseudooceanicola sp.]